MKKNYIIPNQKVALMDAAESVLMSGSPVKSMRVYSGNEDVAVTSTDEVWAKENNSWDNEW